MNESRDQEFERGEAEDSEGVMSGVGTKNTDKAHFRFLHDPHERGTRFLFLTIRCWGSGERPPTLEDAVEGGVGVIRTVYSVVPDIINRLIRQSRRDKSENADQVRPAT